MNASTASLDPRDRPTRVRYGVLGFACSLSMLTYLDRVCFGTASTLIGQDLGLTNPGDLKWAFAAFTFAYAVFEVPSGWLGDVHGPRNVLIRIVLWWSLFTALTGTVGLSFADMIGLPGGGMLIGLGALIVFRFMFGMGEAGAYPNITRALHNWFPFHERGLAQGAVWMSGRIMGGITPLIWMVIVDRWNIPWHMAFWMFGALGIVWCFCFFAWFRNRPEQKPSVNTAELELIQEGRRDAGEGHANVPWLLFLKSSNLWLVCLMYFCTAYGWYFHITYLSGYLEHQCHVDPKSAWVALYKGGPLVLGAIGCLLGGFLTDWYIRRTGSRTWGRRLIGALGHGLCGICWLLSLAYPKNAPYFVFAVSIGALFNDLTLGASWAVCQDIGKRYAAIAAGCMNTIGNLGGFAANVVTGAVLDWFLKRQSIAQGVSVENLSSVQKEAALDLGFQFNFITFGVVYLIGAYLWLRIDPTRPIVPDDERS